MKATLGYVAAMLLCAGVLHAPVYAMDMTAAGGASPSPSPALWVPASKTDARTAYPWCRTSPLATSYYLAPTATPLAPTSNGAKQYTFTLVEDYAACASYAEMRNRTDKLCKETPFYNFMIAISQECHEAIMSVTTVQAFSKEDKEGAKEYEMYAHAHKGHDTGVPLLKYLIKPASLYPVAPAYARRTFTITLRLNKRADNLCQDLATLCGGPKCMVALSDEEYDICPAYSVRIEGVEEDGMTMGGTGSSTNSHGGM